MSTAIRDLPPHGALLAAPAHAMSYAEAVASAANSRTEEYPGPDSEDPRDAETEEEGLLRLSLYHEIKEKLVKRGIPAHEIAFIHDADTPAKKAKLFADMNSGRVRILLGSTAKMGVAMNAQERMIALHHLDAPWRPRDVEQREGRIVRQGNIYDEVYIFQYVTKRSMDCYTWQILESKAKFIHQIMSGEVTQRTAEDIGDMVLTAAQVKAVASGNPKVMERVQLEINLTKLERLRAAYYNDRSSMRFEMSYLPSEAAAAQRDVEWHEQALGKRQQLPDGEFSIRLKKGYQDTEYTVFDKRQDAGRTLRHLADLALNAVLKAAPGSIVHEEVGEYRGFKVFIEATNPIGKTFVGSLFGARVEIQLRAETESRPYVASITDTDVGILQSVDYQLRSIDELLAEASAKKQRVDKKLSEIQAEVSKPWKHLAEYKRMRLRYDRLASELQDEGVKIEAGVTFGQLSEEELEAATDEAEEAGDESSAAYSAYTAEAGAQNNLTGLETAPIIAPHDPRYKIPATLEAVKAQDAQTAEKAQAVETAVVIKEESASESEGTNQGTQYALFESMLAEKASMTKQRKPKKTNPNQMGFAWLSAELGGDQQAALL